MPNHRNQWLRLPFRREKRRDALFLDALDVRAELAQFFVEMLVAAIDVIDAADLGDAVGFQSREDQRGGGAQIARHDRCAEELIDAL